MNDRYNYLLKRYDKIIENDMESHILLIDGKKRAFDEYIHIDLEYIKSVKEYFATLNINELFDTCTLELALSNKIYSKSAVDYILEILILENESFYKTINHIVVTDYHTKLLNIQKISFSNMNIDNEMLLLLKKCFKQLKSMNFSECLIQENSDFYELNCELEFHNCEIENIHSLNYYEKDFLLKNTKINKIKNTTIQSKKIKIDGFDDSTLENLFFLCHFPDLKDLSIGDSTSIYNVEENSFYDKSLLFFTLFVS